MSTDVLILQFIQRTKTAVRAFTASLSDSDSRLSQVKQKCFSVIYIFVYIRRISIKINKIYQWKAMTYLAFFSPAKELYKMLK